MPEQYKSEALAAVHRTMRDLSEIGLVDKAAMKIFDDSCLASVSVEESHPEKMPHSGKMRHAGSV